MDPLGFSLENFDALGKYRTIADGLPVDADAALPDGTKFSGVSGLRQLLQSHQSEFVRTLTEKLLTYALGRGLDYYDFPAVRRIASTAAGDDYRWSALIHGIVTSTPFRMGIAPGVAPEGTEVAQLRRRSQ
jgi:hypothetical protein